MKNALRLIFFVLLTSAFATSMAEAQWVLTNWPSDRAILSFAVSGTNLFVATGGVFVTSNDGVSWSEVDSGITRKSITTLAVIGSNLFASSDEDIYLSTNNGMSWTSIYHDINLTVRCLAVSGDTLFAGVYGGILTTSDDGQKWSTIDIIAYTLTVYGQYLFSDGLRSNLDGSNQMIMSIPSTLYLVNGNDLLAATNTGHGIFISTDSGLQWSPVNSGLIGDSIAAMIAVNRNVFVGTYYYHLNDSQGVLLSTNEGTSWLTVDSGLTNYRISALAICNGYLFAGNVLISGSTNGIWRRPLSDFGISSVAQTTLDRELFSLFPNPTSGILAIRGLSGTVVVMNVLGQTVLKATAKPDENLTLDLTNEPAGIYFVRAGTQSAKIVVSR